MIRRCACVIAAMTYFAACAASGQDVLGASGSETGPTAGPRLINAENLDLQQPSPQGNPLRRIPLNSLFVTRERPLFSTSRRPPPPPPPPPPPAPIAGSSPHAELERPPLTLQGTVIGKPRDIALVLDEVTKSSIRLHVGEEAEGWCLRSVDHRTLTLEKDSRIAVIFFPAPDPSPSSPTTLASQQTNQSARSGDGGSRARTGADWISIAPALY